MLNVRLWLGATWVGSVGRLRNWNAFCVSARPMLTSDAGLPPVFSHRQAGHLERSGAIGHAHADERERSRTRVLEGELRRCGLANGGARPGVRIELGRA